MEQVVGFEPASSAWKAEVLPLNDTCVWSSLSGLNRRPPPYHGGALPTELKERMAAVNRFERLPLESESSTLPLG